MGRDDTVGYEFQLIGWYAVRQWKQATNAAAEWDLTPIFLSMGQTASVSMNQAY